jgi:hypothetical protein
LVATFKAGVTHAVLHWAEGFAEAYGSETVATLAGPVALGIELFDAAKFVGETAATIGSSVFIRPVVEQLKQLAQQIEDVNDVTNVLASKTYFPTRIVVTGVSDDSSSSAVAIGGPVHQYINIFRLVNADDTAGTSYFFGSSGELLTSGPITTHNYRDSNGVAQTAESTIILPQGVLRRFARRLGSSMENPDHSFTFPAAFSFFTPSNGAFDEGLNGFTTSENVSITTDGDGMTVAQLSESSPSSLATGETISSSEAGVLAFDFRWLGNVTPSENATFSADFITPSATTRLFQIQASDPFYHSTDLQRVVVPIPENLLGQTGLLRFLLNPSSFDGVTSRVILGGFDVYAVRLPILVNTAVALSSSINPSLLGQPITLTASVSAVVPGTGLPTGSVQFQIDGISFGLPVKLVNGRATSPLISSLAAGSHQITALYSGDGNFLVSTGQLSQAVHYQFSGFQTPLKLDGSYNLGRDLPIKFGLTDAYGRAAGGLNSVLSRQVQSIDAQGNPLGQPFDPNGAGNTGLRYDAATGQFIFNWKTSGLKAGRYRILLTLDDGTFWTLDLWLK